MPVFLIKQNMTCTDAVKCKEYYDEKLISALPDLIHNDQRGNYHLSIVHEKNNHLLWISIYEKDGQVLTASSKSEIKKPGLSGNYLQTLKIKIDGKVITKGITHFEIIKTEDDRARKYVGQMPDENKLKELLN